VLLAGESVQSSEGKNVLGSRFAPPFFFLDSFLLFLKELQHHAPDTPIILVGTKQDLRTDPDVLLELAENGERPVTTYEGVQMARQVYAHHYLECSALTQKGLKAVFDEVCKVTLLRRNAGLRKRKGIKGLFDKLKKAKDVLFGLDDYRDVNIVHLEQSVRNMEADEIKRLKKELKYEIREAKMYFHLFKDLSRDIVLHILREYHCVDLEHDCREFLAKYCIYARELGLDVKRESVLNKFFGYFRDDDGRQIEQLFFNFRVSTYQKMKQYLPLRKRSLDIAVKLPHATMLFAHSITYFEQYYDKSQAVLVKRMDGVYYPRDFWMWGNRKINKRTASCTEINMEWGPAPPVTGFQYNDIGNCFVVIKRLYPILQQLRIFQRKAPKKFACGNDLDLAQLKKLVFHRCPFDDRVTFSKLPLLEDLTIVAYPDLQVLSREQYRALMGETHLRRFVAVRVDLTQCESEFDILFSENATIEDIIFSDCSYSAASFDDHCLLRDTPSLKLLVLHHLAPVNKQAVFSEKFCTRLVEIAKDREGFQYCVRVRFYVKMLTNMANVQSGNVRVSVGAHEERLLLV